MRLIFLGPPSSGKGTQAVKLAAALNVPHVSTGDLLRCEMAAESELGKLAKGYMVAGNLVPDDVVNAMMRERLSGADCTDFVLDGYPRTVQQAKALEEVLTELQRPLCVAVHIDVPDEVLLERSVGRLVCPQCDAIYHLKAKPPRQLGVCDVCRGVLVVREDDQPSTVRHRLSVYHRITEPVLQFYQKRNLLRDVAGVGLPDDVQKRIRALLPDVCYN